MSKLWHYGEPENGILRVRIDAAERPVNTLSRGALDDLAELVRHVRNDSSLRGVLFFSGKPGNFIAGADVTELKDLAGAQAAREISQLGQQVFQELEDLTVPTVALISGACLGGGLEFALACRYRIADDHSKTLLGLPEVKLGLIPGWGGTVRLPREIGLIPALPLILTGKTLSGYQARSRGLVQDVVPREAFDFVGEKIVDTLHRAVDIEAAEAKLFRPRRDPLWKRIALGNRPAQKLALRKAEKQVEQTTHGHYPAPKKAIDVLRVGLLESPQAGFAAESAAVAELAENPVTAELMRLFFLQETAKKPPHDLQERTDPQSISQAAVVGAGAMGAGVALLLARKGIWTRLKDLKPEFVARGMQTVRKLLKDDVNRRRLTSLAATQALDHLSPTTDYRGLKQADVVIEAVIEDLDVKRQVFQELAEATGPETVLATNTSSLRVEDVARDVPHPERVVGLHFFNPPHRMPLVEVIKTEATSPQALATALALVQRIGKTQVVVGDCTGFLVNRLLSPYMNEAGYLLVEGADPLEIERAAVDFGMPMGPLELTELVGVDVAAHVAQNMHDAYGDHMQPAPLWRALQELRNQPRTMARVCVEESDSRAQVLREVPTESTKARADGLFRKGRGKHKRLARPVKRAIAEMKKSHGKTVGPPPTRETITQRLIYPIINEAARCLEEGVVKRPDEVDLAMVFGTGFAPFRGGPLRYAETVGLENIVSTLDRFAAERPWLSPSDALRRLAASGVELDKAVEREFSTVTA